MSDNATAPNLFHLAIDVSREQGEGFVAQIKDFAAKAAAHMPTYWTVLIDEDNADALHKPGSGPVPEKMQSMLADAGLTGVVSPNDAVVVKSTSDAFFNEEFSNFVGRSAKRQVVITGAHTNACVAESAVGAARTGATVFVVNDHLFNSKDPKASPQAHANALQREVKHILANDTSLTEGQRNRIEGRIRTVLGRELIGALEPQPATPGPKKGRRALRKPIT